MITQTRKYYAPEVGMESLVGIIGIMSTDFPLSFGNYMSILDGPYIVNMWSENLREWSKRNPGFGVIEVTRLSDGKCTLGFITDKNIPDNWKNDKLCVTGHGWGSRELCEAALKFAGLEVGNEICGCEEPTQPPSISSSFSFGNPTISYSCSYCKKNWNDDRKT